MESVRDMTMEQVNSIQMDAYRRHVNALTDALVGLLGHDIYDYGDGETRLTVPTGVVRDAQKLIGR